MISIRTASFDDLEEISIIFKETIKSTCIHQYTENQLEVWSSSMNANKWLEIYNQQFVFVATIDHKIVGFVTFDSHKKYLDLLYVDKNNLRNKIATKLVHRLIKIAKYQNINSIETHSSITAKPFFEQLGFVVVAENVAFIEEISFLNYQMVYKI